MRPTRVRALLLVGVVATVLGLLLQRWLRANGRAMPPVPWTAGIGLLLVACLVYSAALPVRRMIRGGPTARPVDPLRAARAAVLGKATAYAGAVVMGWYVAQVLLLAPDLDVDARRSQAIRAALTAAAALAACVAGLLAERMCRVPPDDRDGPPVGPPPVGPHGAGLGGSGLGGSGTDVTDEARRHD